MKAQSVCLISQGLIPRSSAANKLSEAGADTPQLAAGSFISQGCEKWMGKVIVV